MFDNYVGAKNTKTGAWTAELVLAAVVLHVFAGAALMVRTWWTVEELDRPSRASARLLTAAPPSSPPPAGGSKKIEKKKPKVKKVEEVTQVDERKDKPKVEPDDSSNESEDKGVEGGVEGGVVGGVVGGVLGGVEGGVLGGTLGGDPPPPPPPSEPKIVQQNAIEGSRISGEKDIQPPSSVATAIERSGKRAVGIVKMCLNGSGKVKSLNMTKSTGHAVYDAKLKSEMRRWKYNPYRVNGKPIPVCTSVTFVYIPR
ncbi:MAG: TonB family protein [Myxococcales bacterium]|nr:TonB family protein [Myxococcales bacterium]